MCNHRKKYFISDRPNVSREVVKRKAWRWRPEAVNERRGKMRWNIAGSSRVSVESTQWQKKSTNDPDFISVFTFHHRYSWYSWYNTEECTMYEIKQSYFHKSVFRNTWKPIYGNVLGFLMVAFFRGSFGDSGRFELYAINVIYYIKHCYKISLLSLMRGLCSIDYYAHNYTYCAFNYNN